MEEGYSTNKLPLFKGIKYDYWKEHMIAHFKSIHIDLWDVVEHGNYVPLDDQLNEVSRTSWIDAQRQRFMLNSKARNTLLCTLSKEEYTKVHNYKSANQMWETLALMDEGSSQVKHNKLSLLSHKYELFTMEDGKDIQAMFGCFQTILNELCYLIGTLKVHEQELQQDEGFKRGRSLALPAQKTSSTCKESSSRSTSKSTSKAVNFDTPYDDESNDEGSDEDDQLSFISRKIRII
ncbi:hypothetical protein glysoja_047731, partial [Glycine soja]